MADSGLPRSPFAGMADLAGRKPVRVLSSEEIAQMLASHRLYRETEYHFLPTIRRPRPWTGGDLRSGKGTTTERAQSEVAEATVVMADGKASQRLGAARKDTPAGLGAEPHSSILLI
jgi:hypothetical protein